MQCPKCKGTLGSWQIDRVPTRICDSCGGLWFDRQEIRDYLAQATAVQTDYHRLDLLRESHPEPTGYPCLRCPDTPLARIRA